jgi:predicted aminopeptidase
MKSKHLSGHRALTHLCLCASVALLSLPLTSCHKTCTCIAYNGSSHSYTADEVDDHGVTCSNMVYQAGIQYYSVCSWD